MSRKLTIDQKIRILKEEKLKRLKMQAKMLEYQQNPALWLEERFGESMSNFKWDEFEEYKNHKWDGSPNGLYNAWMSLIQDYTWVAIEAGVGTSKTFWLSRLCYWYVDVFEGGSVFNFAPTAAQLRDNLWKEVSRAFPKFKKIRPNSELLAFELRVDNRNEESYVGDSYGWGIKCKSVGVGSTEDSATAVQGIHGKSVLIILEETPGISSSIITALKTTSVAPNNKVVAVGNPDNRLDTLRQFAELKKVDDYRISSLDYPNVVCKNPLKFAGGATEQSIKDLAEEYGEDSEFFNRRVRGISPKQNKDSLIKVEWFNQCVDHTPTKDAYNALGVDVARSTTGDLASVCYGKSSICTHIQDFVCPSTTALAYNLMYDSNELIVRGIKDYNIPTIHQMEIRPQLVGIDSVGVGVGVTDTMADNGYNVVGLSGGEWVEAIPKETYKDPATGRMKERPLYHFVSLRAQMYWELREALRKQEIGIHIKDKTVLEELRKEITTPKLMPNPKGIKVESKEDIIKRLGYSPNKLDSFVYWFWMSKGYRVQSSVYFPLGA